MTPLETGSEPSLGSLVRRTYRAMSPKRRRQLWALLVGLLIGACAEVMTLGLLLPFLVLISDPTRIQKYWIARQVIAFFGIADLHRLVVPATLGFIVAAIIAGIIRIALQWATGKFSFMLGYDFGVRIYERFLHQPLSWHTQRNSSEVVSLINKVQILSNAVILPSIQTIGAILMSVSIAITLLLVNAFATLFAMAGFALIYFLIVKLVRPPLRRASLQFKAMHQLRIRSVQEGSGGIRDILLDSSQDYFLNSFRRYDAEFRRAQVTASFLAAMPRFTVEAFGMSMVALLAMILAQQGGGLSAALPALGVLALGAQRIMPLAQQIYVAWAGIVANYHTAVEVLDMYAEPMDPQDSIPAAPIPFHKAIGLESVSFRYEGHDPLVLDSIDLSIPKGSRVGFIGKSGSGKSTLIDIVMGLQPPISGQLTIDGVTADDRAKRRAWQANIAHVPQSIFLADTTIAENVAFGVPIQSIDHSLVDSALAEAGLSELMKQLPEGAMTQIGERGVRLSGGQRQRLGIARALYKRVNVLVFDEATSALDGATEAAVMDAINGLSNELTILMVAHRLSTLRECDRVYELSHGEIKMVQLA